MAEVEAAVGRRFGDPSDPLLVSVRSGAPVSMPGMMDTILNLGLNDATTAGLARAAGDAAFARSCRERFDASFRSIVGVDRRPDGPVAPAARRRSRPSSGPGTATGRGPIAQKEGIPDDLGTAVTVQAMVFGNRGATSATGVLFTRNPATGEPTLYGDVMFDAQGEDVVAGTHQTEPITVLDERMPAVAAELRDHAARLEHHYADLCDIEFTIEDGRLWMLQVRVGKRSPQAALRIARRHGRGRGVPAVTRAEAVERVLPLLAHPPTVDQRPQQLRSCRSRPGCRPRRAWPAARSSPSPEAAQAAADAGRAAILVRAETSPDDVHGMARGGRDPDVARRSRQSRRGRGPRLGDPGGRRRGGDRGARRPRRRRRPDPARRATSSRSTAAPARSSTGASRARPRSCPRRGPCSRGPRSSGSRSATLAGRPARRPPARRRTDAPPAAR